MAQHLGRSSSGVFGSSDRARTRALKSSQESSRLRMRSPGPGVTEGIADIAAQRSSPSGADLVLGQAEVPLEHDALALGVADDALTVAPELRVVAGQQHEAGEDPRPELLHHAALAEVAVDLPVRRHGAQVHDAGVRPGRDGFRSGERHRSDATGWTHPSVRSGRRKGSKAACVANDTSSCANSHLSLELAAARWSSDGVAMALSWNDASGAMRKVPLCTRSRRGGTKGQTA